MAKPTPIQTIQETLPRGTNSNAYGTCGDPGTFDRAGGYYYWGGNKDTRKNPHICPRGVACQPYLPCPSNGGGFSFVCSNFPVSCTGGIDVATMEEITRRVIQ